MTDWYERARATIRDGECDCWACERERGGFTVRMITCEECGNKRCPKASDHRLDCTGSNEPGQPGSVYE